MDYYKYQILLQQQQSQQQQQPQISAMTSYKIPQIPLQSTLNTSSNTSYILQQPQQLSQQSILQQGNFKDNQQLGQKVLQLQDLNMMGNLLSQQNQQIMDTNMQIQQYTSPADADVNRDMSNNAQQQAFFQKAIQNQYVNNIQQNREDIIRNYISLISSSKMNRNRNPSNDNRNRNPSNDNRNRNPSNDNRNMSNDNRNHIEIQYAPQFQVNNIMLQQQTPNSQNQFASTQQFINPQQFVSSQQQYGPTFLPEQTLQYQFQQQQQAQKQQLFIQNTNQLQSGSSWIQPAGAATLPELSQQFIGDINSQQQQLLQRNQNFTINNNLQQQQQLQINLGINLNDIFQSSSTLSKNQLVIGENKLPALVNPMINFTNQLLQQQQVKPTIIETPIISLQKLNEDSNLDSMEKQILNLQQQIAQINSQVQELNQSQAEILSQNNYLNNKNIIDYLEQQIQNVQIQKQQLLEQIDQLQNLKLAFIRFKQIYPEGNYQQFMNLSHETQLLFLKQITPSSLQNTETSTSQTPVSLKIEKTPLNLQFSQEAQFSLQKNNYVQISSNKQQQIQDDQKSNSSNSQSNGQKKNPFKIIRSSDNSEDQDISQNNKRDISKQSPSFSLTKSNQDTLKNHQQQLKEQTVQKPIVDEQTISQQNNQTENIELAEKIQFIEKEQRADNLQQQEKVLQQIEDKNQSNDEDDKDQIDEEDDEQEHDHDHDNTTIAQTTMSIALRLSTMNAAESKKFEKRREKLEENVLKILSKQEDACSMIKPIALELCSKIAVENDILKNRPYEAISAAVIVHASRLVANPITVKKMSKITESKEKIINRVFMYLKKNVEGFNNKMPQPEVFIKNICDKMDLSEAISKTAFFLHQQSDILGLVKGQHAATVAACIVKLAACLNNIEMTVKQICEASNVCQISLRQLYRSIYPHRFELIGDHKINGIDFKKMLNSPQMNID